MTTLTDPLRTLLQTAVLHAYRNTVSGRWMLPMEHDAFESLRAALASSTPGPDTVSLDYYVNEVVPAIDRAREEGRTEALAAAVDACLYHVDKDRIRALRAVPVEAPAPVPSSGTLIAAHVCDGTREAILRLSEEADRIAADWLMGAGGAPGAWDALRTFAKRLRGIADLPERASETRTAPAIWETLSGTFEVRASCPRHPFAPMRRCGEIARCSECGDAIAICDDICGWKHCVREKGHAGLHVSPSGTSWPSPRTARPQGDPDHEVKP